MWKPALVCLLFFTELCSATAIYHYTPAYKEAGIHLAALRLSKAEAIIKAEQSKEPENLVGEYLLSFIDCYRLLIHMDEIDYRTYKANVSLRSEKFKKLSDLSPAKGVVLSELYLQSGLCKAAFEDYFQAALDFRTSYGYIKRNQEKFPAHFGNKKNLGILTALIGTLPDNYMWIANAIGLEGNYTEGSNLLKEYVQQCVVHNEAAVERQEALFMYLLMNVNFGNDKVGSWEMCKQYTTGYKNSLSDCYLRAFLAQKCGQNDESLHTLLDRPTSPDFEPLILMDFLLGSAKLNKLEVDADIWFKRFVTYTKGKANVQEAYKKLSWVSLLQGDKDKFIIYRNLSIKAAKHLSDEESLIGSDLEKHIYPDEQLLKARLLCDGGYLSQALKVMELIQESKLKSHYQRIEYFYRYGRIYQEMKDRPRATHYLKETVVVAGNVRTYMAPNACLQLGYLYKSANRPLEAESSLKKLFSYSSYEYKGSIQQQGKALQNQLKHLSNK